MCTRFFNEDWVFQVENLIQNPPPNGTLRMQFIVNIYLSTAISFYIKWHDWWRHQIFTIYANFVYV